MATLTIVMSSRSMNRPKTKTMPTIHLYSSLPDSHCCYVSSARRSSRLQLRDLRDDVPADSFQRRQVLDAEDGADDRLHPISASCPN